MKAKHTPGPWSFVVDGGGGNFRLSAGEVGVIWGCGCCDSPWLGGEDHESDARLIAAAPELLEALEGVLSAAEHAYHTAAFGDPDGGDWWERIKRARAAIAKATGADQ